MTGVLDVPQGAVLAALEAAAAAGDERAESLLATLLEEEAATGGLCVISRLAAKRYWQFDRKDPE